ncbi:MAG: aminomethyl-transferring glycine dehydrogenase subunit GcvPA [Candidatus Omnitrophota bacterium]
MDYIPHTPYERREMLAAAGLATENDLFRSIPAALRNPEIPFPAPMTEMEIADEMEDLARRNEGRRMASFLGGGAYRHFIPQALKSLLSRGDFVTAYTPYQAEASQGTLQSIYEFQTLMCRLTGMEAANASMYDGASALAEAALMACRLTRKEKIAVSAAANPHYCRVLNTYLVAAGIEVVEIPHDGGATCAESLKRMVDASCAGVFLQNPNYFGVVEPMDSLSAAAKEAGALLGVAVYPISLGLLKPPGAYNADIVLGDLQPLGMPLSFGGPYAGFIACKGEYIRQLPGRLAGRTTDADGKTGYVLTLQTREQHIRRAKATSNICTNQALCALAAAMYLFTMGARGLQQAAERSVRNARALQERLCGVKGVRLAFQKPFFNEFVLELPIPIEHFLAKAKEEQVAPGIRLAPGLAGEKEALLVCATELTRKADMERYAEILTKVME